MENSLSCSDVYHIQSHKSSGVILLGITSYLKDKLLNAIVKNKTFQGPKELYVGLYKDNGEEVNAVSYERQQIKFTEPTDSKVVNKNKIIFPPAKSDYGTIVQIGILSEFQGGDLLFIKKLDSSVIVDEGIEIYIQESHLKIDLF